MPEEEYTGLVFSQNPPPFTKESPFIVATRLADAAKDFVEDQIGYIKDEILAKPEGWAGAIGSLEEQMTKLGDFTVNIPDDLQFMRPDINPELHLDMEISDIDTTTFGSITPFSPGNAPELTDPLPEIDDPDIQPFKSSISGPDIPPAPGITPITEPGEVPPNPGFEYPPDPIIEPLPDDPVLFGFSLPPPPEITLPTLELTDFPTLSERQIETLIDWTEPTYTPEIWADVKNQIQTFFAGGTGFRPDVEEAMVNRGRDREDRVVRQEVQAATEEWANRGYTAPPGMLARRIDNIRDEGTLKKLGLQREVVIKAMDAELENLRFAVQQGIVAEGLFVQIHLAAVERLFMVQRLNVEWQIQLYNLAVQVYQARMQENLIRAQVYEAQVRAALAEVEIFKALVDAERAKAEVNLAIVQSYTAQIQARKVLVDLYVAQVGAVKVRAEVYAIEVGAYGEEVDAFAAKVGAESLKFDRYKTQVEAESVKADIIEAEARAYAAEMGGIETGVNAQVARLGGAISTFQAEVEAYNSNLRYWLGLNQSELGQIQANVAGHSAHTQRFVAEAGVEIESNKLEATIWEATNSISLATYQVEIERIKAIMEKAIQEAGLMLEAIKSAGELSSTISAGALAALHVGAQSSGSGSVDASARESISHSQGESYAKNCATNQTTAISYEADSMPGYFCGFDETCPTTCPDV